MNDTESMRQSDTTRLKCAERDLAHAEEHLEHTRAWQPSLLTSASDLSAMREAALNRVLRLRARVSIRREAVARVAAQTKAAPAAGEEG